MTIIHGRLPRGMDPKRFDLVRWYALVLLAMRRGDIEPT